MPRSCTTFSGGRAFTTLIALASGLKLVVPGGIITVVVYPGHEGGRVETEAVLSWARAVSAHRALVACHQVLNTREMGPLLLAVAKKS
ncbi:MAG: class I SAM-dependent methyltransferase [Isosphaeraceae bacterium]